MGEMPSVPTAKLCGRSGEERIPVHYFALKPQTLSEERWRVECPFCGGGLFTLRRDSSTGELLDIDHCTMCGQRIRFLDIERMRFVDDKGHRGVLGLNALFILMAACEKCDYA